MEALSMQQELLLDSDTGHDSLDEDEKEDNIVNADDGALADNSGNQEESSSYTENDVEFSSSISNNDVNNVASLQEDFRSDSSLGATLVAPRSLCSSILPEFEIDAKVASCFKDVNDCHEPEMNILKDE
ncbi:hypothetical protein SDJN03_24293, partial [Cucurbita argyrosperma subsp. sororia]